MMAKPNQPAGPPMTLGKAFIVTTSLFVGLISSLGYAQPNKVEYELRERWGSKHPSYSKPSTVRQSQTLIKDKPFTAIEITTTHL